MSYVWLDLTDVTLADEDTNSILADNAKRAIQGNEAMRVDKFIVKSIITFNSCKLALITSLHHLHCLIALNCPIDIISQY